VVGVDFMLFAGDTIGRWAFGALRYIIHDAILPELSGNAIGSNSKLYQCQKGAVGKLTVTALIVQVDLLECGDRKQSPMGYIEWSSRQLDYSN
jgi:hypothetical protein